MLDVNEVYERNKDSLELRGWVGLYRLLFENDDAQIDDWREFQSGTPARYILAAQRQFVKDFSTENFLELHRPALDKNLNLLKSFRSFAIAYCRGDEKLVFYDFV